MQSLSLSNSFPCSIRQRFPTKSETTAGLDDARSVDRVRQTVSPRKTNKILGQSLDHRVRHRLLVALLLLLLVPPRQTSIDSQSKTYIELDKKKSIPRISLLPTPRAGEKRSRSSAVDDLCFSRANLSFGLTDTMSICNLIMMMSLVKC